MFYNRKSWIVCRCLVAIIIMSTVSVWRSWASAVSVRSPYAQKTNMDFGKILISSTYDAIKKDPLEWSFLIGGAVFAYNVSKHQACDRLVQKGLCSIKDLIVRKKVKLKK